MSQVLCLTLDRLFGFSSPKHFQLLSPFLTSEQTAIIKLAEKPIDFFLLPINRLIKRVVGQELIRRVKKEGVNVILPSKSLVNFEELNFDLYCIISECIKDRKIDCQLVKVKLNIYCSIICNLISL